ncbi:hypothetical protein DFH07DRAFT_349005 [Mycena maculata]|uniref:Ankyrin repeat protein n=1 Tax=Mycena maculata TaxID=230809 RepID=A0AAD7HC32_9AGAR|nr:hypothetical protein DFH07DRAFT_349005 [Mycena maculata]
MERSILYGHVSHPSTRGRVPGRDGKDYLAAFDGDVLAVYEALGLGATADKPDKSGITPLCLAVSQLATCTSPLFYGVRHDGGRMTVEDHRRAISCLKWAIRILVEQHADVSKSMGGIPFISLLRRCKAWDVITLFLQHGAARPKRLTAVLPTKSDQDRFTAIPVPSCRPAQKCPCWSGKSVAECHGREPQPYPSAYMCVCGSKNSKGSRKTCKIVAWPAKVMWWKNGTPLENG